MIEIDHSIFCTIHDCERNRDSLCGQTLISGLSVRAASKRRLRKRPSARATESRRTGSADAPKTASTRP
jgi:hypothetical protein